MTEGLALSRRRVRWRGKVIYTIGHSTRPIVEFISLLRECEISVVADIRTIPRSRHNPQFSGDALRSALRERGLRYRHLALLGGLRRPQKASKNAAWRNASFRGYADYMLGEDFERGLEELRELVEEGSVALMCAETVPWRCHRSLVADVLTVRGADVRHIVGSSRPHAHRLTAFAKVSRGRVTYPAQKTISAASGRAARRRSTLTPPVRASRRR